MKTAVLAIIVAFCCTPELSAQKTNGEIIDSLRIELAKAKPDTNKAFLLQLLSYKYYRNRTANTSRLDSCRKYAWQAMELSTKLSWKFGIAKAHYAIACSYHGADDKVNATKHFEQALQLYRELNDRKGIAAALRSLGINAPDTKTAELYYNQAVQAAKEVKDNVIVRQCLEQLAGLNLDAKNYPKALEFNLKVLKYAEEVGDKVLQAAMLGGIGSIYHRLFDYDKAVEYSAKALQLFKESGQKENLEQMYINVGFAYYLAKQYPKALELHFQALRLGEELHDEGTILTQYNNIALTYYKLSDFPNAMAYFSKSVALNRKMQSDYIWGWDYFGLGGSYLALAKGAAPDQLQILCKGSRASALQKAKLYTDSSIIKFKKLENELIDVYQQKSEIEKLLGNYKIAYEYYELYTSYKDSNAVVENLNRITGAVMKYDVDKKDAAAKAEQEKKDILQANIRNSVVGVLTGALIFLFVVYRQRNKVKEEKRNVEKEKERSDNLLLNILPAEVAEELKATGTAAAKHFDNVTVLFTDFKSFTNVSEQLTPQELVDELHACFKVFDEIITKYNIEKIKTIGDAYLAVCGLPIADEKHAENVVNAALAIREFMESRRQSLGEKTFEIRIGINSGSVVAGIVGVKKFAYDIWGDTVNTAARMEQHSEAGKINISETTFESIKGKFPCEYRGEIDAKNKGKLKMYFVENLS
ncbi:MAG: tetratricopeptide repeat protein [Bacteroidetes bacterium]|nr:tetratricopeptide repeat protein [Bacteroidota bacterium]